jgi:hypothetical protein
MDNATSYLYQPLHISAPSAFFTYTEFLDVIDRAKVGQAFLPNRDASCSKLYLEGDPGAVRAILNILATSDVGISADLCNSHSRRYVPFSFAGRALQLR